MIFTQTIEVDGADEQALEDHITSWHTDQAGQAPGYLGARLRRDVDRPGRHVIGVDFSSPEHAEQNNSREATNTWAEELRSMISGDPVYRNLQQVYVTPN